MQTQRPTCVTAISWLLLVLSAFGIVVMLGTAVAIEFDSRFMLLVVGALVASIIQIVMAVGMLNGKNWARLLFLGLTPISVVVGLAAGTAGAGTFLKVAWYVVFAVYLTRPRAVGYFQGASSESQQLSLESR